MIEKLISKSARHPYLIFLFTLIMIGWGVFALKNITLDAIPDLSDPQVIIFTEWKGRSPDLIEDQITYPIVSSMVAAPGVQTARGISMFGMSFVYLILEEGTDLYWGRSRVLEYLSKIQNNLPEGVTPTLGPDASGVGWVLSYSLINESGQTSIEDLRSFQDWKLRYLLEAIPGVAEVASVGGYVKQYQIQVNPNALAQYGITIHQITKQVRESNRDVGGRVLEMSEREYFIRGLGYIQSLEDIRNIVLRATPTGEVLQIKDVAQVVEGPEIRRGAVDLNGKGEAVSGIVVMRYGEDALTVISQVKDTLKHIEPSLPNGTKIIITYDRSKVIKESVKTLFTKLIEEMIVVSLIIFIFLLHFRSSLIPFITLPVAVLFSFIPMYHFGITSNIMSLAGIAIAIGAMVDGSIILIEDAHKSLEHWKEGDKKSLKETLIHACQEVGRPIFFSLLIIAVSFTPIFTLEGQEGRLFKPLAFTKNFSMFFAAILAVTLAPALIVKLLQRPNDIKFKNKTLTKIFNFIWVGKIYPEEGHPISRLLYKLYQPAQAWILKHAKMAVLIAILSTLTIIPVFFSLGQEFMPSLNEGDILYMPTTLPGISIEKSKEWMQQQNKLIKKFDEVKTIFGKAGRAETATDPAPLSMIETVIQLHPQEEWPKVYHERWYSNWLPNFLKPVFALIWPEMKKRNWQELIEDLNQTVKLPGTTNAWVFPIKTRIDMLTTGIRTPIGVKIFGDDLDTLEKVAIQIEGLAQNLEGTRSVIAERSMGGYYIDIKLKRENLAAHGLTIEDANKLIEGVIGGMNVTTIIDGRARYPVNIRYQQDYRSDIERMKRSLVSVNENKHIPLMEIANVEINRGPAMIKDENGLLTTWVYIDLKNDTDMGRYVDNLNQTILNSKILPTGYTYKISGQYEFLERAKERLKIVIPLTLFIIIFLLYWNTKNWVHALMVISAFPFAWLGAFWLLWFLDYNISIAVWVGLIALAGVDAETSVVMLMYLDLAFQKRKEQGLMRNESDLKESIMDGAVKRIRPKVMTVLTTFLGLLPIMWASQIETGADVAKRITAPMVGGIFTSFFLELFIFPCLYLLWKKREFKLKG